MKRVDNLYKDICCLDDIIKMTNKVCGKVRNKRKVGRFELYKMEHILNIKNRLDSRGAFTCKYNIFMITDPKCRIVMGLDIEDKIINHLVAEYFLVKVFDSKYGNSMCATRVGKGTSYGVKLLKKYLNDIKRDYDNFYILKFDIKKYFYSIDHSVLRGILRKKIKDKNALNILDSIIDSTNENYINENINSLKESRIKYLHGSNLGNKCELIEEIEDIPLYEYGKGCPIGNQTSQAFGLIYLYELIHFIKEDLHIKYIVNYMDDFVIIHNDKDYLKYCLKEIICKLRNEYKLDVNLKKTKIDSIKNGIDFLGYRFYVKNNKVIMKVRNRTKKKFKRRVRELSILRNYNLISRIEINRDLASYKGIILHGDGGSLYYKWLKNIS